MNDIQKLKALAEAATPGPWTVSEEHESASFQGYVVGDQDGWIAIFGFTNQDADNADYVAAANPAAVLELIAEIERLKEDRERIRGQRMSYASRCEEALEVRDQLKAENFDLGAGKQAAEEEIARLKAENEALREKADCVDDCAHLIRKLVHCRRQLATDGDLAEKALDYLKRKGLQGSPLRGEADHG